MTVWLPLLRISAGVLAVDVAVMHVWASAMSAGYPHLSGFGWSLIAVGYLALSGVLAGLVGVHRSGADGGAAHPAEGTGHDRRELVRALDVVPAVDVPAIGWCA